uniref:LIM zinc-binding domain-containing protein n=1 Tax=Oncorhynchus mykiss TaxID=8022 RepID=A0A8K9V0A3_ONCMY
MPKCPKCTKEVYFAERVTSLGKDWHRPCLKCEKCNKTLSAGSHAEHDGKPYCNSPCYSALFGPKDLDVGELKATHSLSRPTQVHPPHQMGFKKKATQRSIASSILC